MIIETTINIHKTIMDRLGKSSISTGRSRNFIIVLLLKRAMEENRKMLRFNTAVKYQEEDPLKQWHKFHVQYRNDMYEFCHDMRKFYKMSVSRILALSVMRYLDEIVIGLIEGDVKYTTDNYLFSCYIFLQEVIEGAILWKYSWGIPTKMTNIFSHNENSG